MWNRVRDVIWLIALGFAGIAGASYLGALHPIGDSLAVLRWQCAAVAGGLGLLLWATGWRRGALLALGGVVMGAPIAAAALWTQTPRDEMPGGTLLVYQKNVHFQLPSIGPMVDDLRVTAPDILTLQEVSGANQAILDAVRAQLPHQHVCNFVRIGAVAVATRLPPVPEVAPLCREQDGIAGLLVQGPDGPLWVVSVHFYWPWPRSQSAQMARLAPVLSALDAPIIAGGDFNMVPWGQSLQRFRKASDTTRLGPLRNTFPRFAPWIPLPIDHIYVPQGSIGGTQMRSAFLSDHLGLLGWVHVSRPE